MEFTPVDLEVTAHSLTAILGLWLGLTVLTRSSAPTARVVAFLALALVAWSSGVIVQRLSTSLSAVEVAHGIEELAASLILPAAAHFSLLIATEGHPSRRQVRATALAYVVNIAFAVPGVLDRSAPIAIAAPQLNPGLVPGAVLGWAWIVARLATLLASIGWLLGAFRTASDPLRRRQLGVTLATVAVGGFGGVIRLLSVVSPTDPWIGVALVSLAMVMAVSVVFAPGVFFAPEVAGRAFWTSMGLGLGLFLLVGALLAVDTASRSLLGLDLPLLTLLALVVTVALYEPVVGWGRARLGGRSPSALAHERLLAAIGQPSLGARAAAAGVQPALSRVARVLNLTGATVTLADGSVVASAGLNAGAADATPIELVAEDEVIGELRVTRLPGAPLSASDKVLLRLSAEYVAAALRTDRREDEQAEALTGLTRDRANVDASATNLLEALVRHSSRPPGLRIFALGPFRVERAGARIERWGGEKAGTRQAQALFAFLFDRGERGVAKEEALALIWPDTDMERADLAFHRTLGGLRHTLETVPAGDGDPRAIRFHNDRYRLEPTLIDWSDVAEFLARVDSARRETGIASRLRLLDEARPLYRGEYLDDCPFYGDSVHVEDRRGSLRGRFIDLLIELGQGHETAGDRASAVSAYRDAMATAVDGCEPAEAGMARLASRE